ncbi:ran-binding protein 10-like [Lichtheimia corymbifera JMRC:FSU:9682]|uniref:Ran-binding protein 10-like n=1 Tax=Lichtheimia corymbifera JMRC:FSU:9682 TaxID=1263082 RepID=A0A068SCT0_9FUNG|nr:ran-binding protein 10-like [Lichtheimia corymbifera JMRC:FSU:9682]
MMHIEYLNNTLYSEMAQLPWSTTPHLPRRLNGNDMFSFLLRLENDTEVYYQGCGRDIAALVRSDAPIPIECGIYYYEMHIISKGEHGYIGIGFCHRENNLDILPGWEDNSWGYHGDDGNSFHDGDPTRYGPLFTTGDVVGCGVDIAQGKAFFTKNGVYLGIAFDNIDTSRDLFPCFGLNTEGERITVNFGQVPFVFDIENHVQKQRADTLRRLRKQCEDRYFY